jgi:hypothetical protein
VYYTNRMSGVESYEQEWKDKNKEKSLKVCLYWFRRNGEVDRRRPGEWRRRVVEDETNDSQTHITSTLVPNTHTHTQKNKEEEKVCRGLGKMGSHIMTLPTIYYTGRTGR